MTLGMEKSGKSGNLKIFRVWKMTLGMEKSGKVNHQSLKYQIDNLYLGKIVY